MWARTRVPREKTDKMFTRAPVHPPREGREGGYRSNREPKAETEAEGDGTRPTRSNRKQILIKEGQANYGKQMKSRVQHLV